MLRCRTLGYSPAPVEVSFALSGLDFCGPTCLKNKLKKVGGTIWDAGSDIAGAVGDAITKEAKAWRDSVSHLTGERWENFKDGWEAVYKGAKVIGEFTWDKLGDACAFFAEHKDLINAGVLIVEGNYVAAAAQLAELGAAAVGVPLPVDISTDSQMVEAAEAVCGAMDTVNTIVALGQGMPVPPPIGSAEAGAGKFYPGGSIRSRPLLTKLQPGPTPKLLTSPADVAGYIEKMRAKNLSEIKLREQWMWACNHQNLKNCAVMFAAGRTLADSRRSNKRLAIGVGAVGLIALLL